MSDPDSLASIALGTPASAIGQFIVRHLQPR
jgi:hypothetical protein